MEKKSYKCRSLQVTCQNIIQFEGICDECHAKRFVLCACGKNYVVCGQKYCVDCFGISGVFKRHIDIDDIKNTIDVNAITQAIILDKKPLTPDEIQKRFDYEVRRKYHDAIKQIHDEKLDKIKSQCDLCHGEKPTCRRCHALVFGDRCAVCGGEKQECPKCRGVFLVEKCYRCVTRYVSENGLCQTCAYLEEHEMEADVYRIYFGNESKVCLGCQQTISCCQNGLCMKCFEKK